MRSTTFHKHRIRQHRSNVMKRLPYVMNGGLTQKPSKTIVSGQSDRTLDQKPHVCTRVKECAMLTWRLGRHASLLLPRLRLASAHGSQQQILATKTPHTKWFCGQQCQSRPLQQHKKQRIWEAETFESSLSEAYRKQRLLKLKPRPNSTLSS